MCENATRFIRWPARSSNSELACTHECATTTLATLDCSDSVPSCTGGDQFWLCGHGVGFGLMYHMAAISPVTHHAHLAPPLVPHTFSHHTPSHSAMLRRRVQRHIAISWGRIQLTMSHDKFLHGCKTGSQTHPPASPTPSLPGAYAWTSSAPWWECNRSLQRHVLSCSSPEPTSNL